LDVYQYEGTLGEHVIIRVDPDGVNTGFDCILELYGPSDTLLIKNIDEYNEGWPYYNHGGRQVNFVDYVLPESGTYTIYVSESGGDVTSNYWLSLQCRDYKKSG
jgi:hypothetical protein